MEDIAIVPYFFASCLDWLRRIKASFVRTGDIIIIIPTCAILGEDGHRTSDCRDWVSFL